eukprot:m.9173 g.9173  ORF g.9173 m.9173 type:complete len:670 (-) comp6848_c0_seq1:160-2169(-)
MTSVGPAIWKKDAVARGSHAATTPNSNNSRRPIAERRLQYHRLKNTFQALSPTRHRTVSCPSSPLLHGFRRKNSLRITCSDRRDERKHKLSRSPEIAALSDYTPYCSTDDEGLGTSPPSKSVVNSFDVGREEDVVLRSKIQNENLESSCSDVPCSTFPTPQNSGASIKTSCQVVTVTQAPTTSRSECLASLFSSQGTGTSRILHCINGNTADADALFAKGFFRKNETSEQQPRGTIRRSSEGVRTPQSEWTPENSTSRQQCSSPLDFSRFSNVFPTVESLHSIQAKKEVEVKGLTKTQMLASCTDSHDHSDTSSSANSCSPLLNASSCFASVSGDHTHVANTAQDRALSDESSSSFNFTYSDDAPSSNDTCTHKHAKRREGENEPLEAFIGYLEASANETSGDMARAHYNHARRLEQQLQHQFCVQAQKTPKPVEGTTNSSRSSMEQDILRHYEIAASLGHTKSMVNAAVRLLESATTCLDESHSEHLPGADGKEKRVRAKRLLSQACDRGDARALLYVASLLRDGNKAMCVKADARTAAKLLKHAVKVTSCEHVTPNSVGDVDDNTQQTQVLRVQALMELTSCHLTGSGVPMDPARAFKYCHQGASFSAELGLCGAKHSVAAAAYALLERMYSDGVGTCKDAQKAKHWRSRRKARNRHTHRRLDKAMA